MAAPAATGGGGGAVVSERSLLERLREPARESERIDHDNLEAMEKSILLHLQRMLNTRQENSQTVPNYGVPDLTEMGRNFPESARVLEGAIKRSVEEYEPRLRDVRVKFRTSEDEVLTLSFDVTARLVTRGEQASVQFETRLSSDGRFVVTG